ncbi:MAG: DJ-1/PfpI family protein [Candidatus Woesearchaeota archaeon]
MSVKTVLMVIASEDFKDEEYFILKQIFEENSIKVITASTKNKAISTADKIQDVDMLLDDIDDIQEYCAIVFVGGPGAGEYFQNKKAHELARDFDIEGRIIAAICIAPVTLANAGLLKEKRATVFPSGKQELIDNGAKYTGKHVERDANFITADGPSATKEFAEEIVEALRIY